jgi:hypothetical protein
MTGSEVVSELQIKVLDALTSLIERRKAEQIDGPQFEVGLQTLWLTAAGYIDRETSELISSTASNEPVEPRSTRIFSGPKGLCIVRRRGITVELIHTVDGRSFAKRNASFSVETNGYLLAKQRADELAAGLLKQGYKEV